MCNILYVMIVPEGLLLLPQFLFIIPNTMKYVSPYPYASMHGMFHLKAGLL